MTGLSRPYWLRSSAICAGDIGRSFAILSTGSPGSIRKAKKPRTMTRTIEVAAPPSLRRKEPANDPPFGGSSISAEPFDPIAEAVPEPVVPVPGPGFAGSEAVAGFAGSEAGPGSAGPPGRGSLWEDVLTGPPTRDRRRTCGG